MCGAPAPEADVIDSDLEVGSDAADFATAPEIGVVVVVVPEGAVGFGLVADPNGLGLDNEVGADFESESNFFEVGFEPMFDFDAVSVINTVCDPTTAGLAELLLNIVLGFDSASGVEVDVDRVP